MNDADSAPSPNRFCRRFGIRNAALKASAAIVSLAPRNLAFSDSRTTPSNRESRMPAATRAAARPRDDEPGVGGGGDAALPAMLSAMSLSRSYGDRALRRKQQLCVRPCGALHVVEQILSAPREHREVIQRAFLPMSEREQRATHRLQIVTNSFLAALDRGEQPALRSA